MRIRLRLAYDGTAYNGFQCQSNGVAVQDVLNRALHELFGHPVKTMGASRTDTGVHARDNVAAFDVETRIAPDKISYALNARLPEDIRVVSSDRVPDDWHPRFQDTIKTYEYHIINRRHPDPLTRNTEMHYYYPLDEIAMNRAASYFVGEHDFASFCASGYSSSTTVRRILRSEVVRDGDRIIFYITGTGFLYNMVRIIAGTLIEIGAGKYPPETIPEILEAKDRSKAGPTAVAKGLVLAEIRYPADEKPPVLVIGAGEFQVPLIRKCHDLGFCVHAAAWRDGAVGARFADHFFPVSITEKEKLLALCEQVKPRAVLSVASDLAEITANYLQHAMGLPGNPAETSYLASDKAKMREAWEKAGLPVPGFREIRLDDTAANPEESSETGKISGEGPDQQKLHILEKIPKDLKFPVIIKPADRSGSRGICRIDDPEDRNALVAAVRAAIGHSFSGRAIVEEYFSGPEYSCECISQGGVHRMLAVTRKYTTGAPHYIEVAHVQPSGLPPEKLSEVRDTVFAALDALYVKNGASHTEFRIGGDGCIRLIEAGARMGGDEIGTRLVPLTTGYDYLGMVIDTALGEKISPEQRKPAVKAAAVRFIFTEEDAELYRKLRREDPSRIIEISGELCQENPGFTGTGNGDEAGEKADRTEGKWETPEDSGSRHGYFIVTGESPEELEEILNLVDKM